MRGGSGFGSDLSNTLQSIALREARGRKVPADHQIPSKKIHSVCDADWSRVSSKCAPAPIPRSATRDRALGHIITSPASDEFCTCACARDRRGRGGGRSRIAPVPIPILPAPAGGLPVAVSIPAVLACPRRVTLGVKVGTVIQQHGVMGIGVAEDMSTVSAMVTTFEQVEGFVAGGRIANGGIGIGLPVVPRGETFDRPEGPIRLGWGF